MRRSPLGVLLAATLVVTACGERTDHALGPQSVSQLARPPLAADVSPSCPADSATIVGWITNLFSGGNQTAALSKFDQIMDLLGPTPPGPDTLAADSNTVDLIGWTLQKYQAGQLNSGTTAQQVVDLVNGLLCAAGLPYNFTPDNLSPDGAWALITTSTPDTTVTTGTLHAGVRVDTGSVTQTVLLTITPITTPYAPPAGPLNTQLDQYPLFYKFTVTPDVPFTLPVLVGTCQSQSLAQDVQDRLRIAHNVGDGIEILPRQLVTFLDCSDVTTSLRSSNPLVNFAMAGWHTLSKLLGPAPLYAAGCCLGGSAKTFSPFGAVDPLLYMRHDSPDSLGWPVGGTVPQPPSVSVKTPAGNAYTDLPVEFAVTAGGGSVTGASTTTDATGVATVGSWTLGSTTGLDTVTATATNPYPGMVTIDTNPQYFQAEALPPTQVAFTVQPSAITAGQTMSAVKVAIEDENGVVVTSSAAQVMLAVTGGGATLGGTTTQTAVNGVATFSNLTVTKAGTWTLTASSPSLTSGTSSSFTVSAAAADTIFSVAGDNQSALFGTAVAVAPAVRVTDQYGNPVEGVAVTFTAQNGGSVAGANQSTDVTGTATVGSWTLVAGTNYLLAGTSLGLEGEPVTFTATGLTSYPTLVDCLPSNGSGDALSHGFYIPKYPGTSLSQVDVYLSSNASASTPTPYTIQLIAKLNGFDGQQIGSSTETVYLRGASSENLPTHFVFGTLPSVSKRSTVTFQFNVLSNPNNATLTFNVGSCGVGNTHCKTSCDLIETTDASGSLSTFYRDGTAAKIYGAN
jgi:hypothetical protein